MDMHDSRRVRLIAASWVAASMLLVVGGQASATGRENGAASKPVASDARPLAPTATPAETQSTVVPITEATPTVPPPPPAPPTRATSTMPPDAERAPSRQDSDSASSGATNTANWAFGLATVGLLGMIVSLAGALLLYSRVKELEAAQVSVQVAYRGELQELKQELETSQRRGVDLAHQRLITELERVKRELREDSRVRGVARAAEAPAIAPVRRPVAGVQRTAPSATGSLPDLSDAFSNEATPFIAPPIRTVPHPVLLEAIMRAIKEVANSGTSITAANAAARILSAARDENVRHQLAAGQFGVEFFDTTGRASVQTPALMAIRFDASEDRCVVPFPQAGRSSGFVGWFGTAEYKTNPVLAQRPAIGVIRGDGVLSMKSKGSLVSA